MRKWKWLALAAGAAFLLASGVIANSHRRSPVTLETYQRIVAGMTRTEVKALLGPPGDYRTAPMTTNVQSSAECELLPHSLGSSTGSLCWKKDSGSISVSFDYADRSSFKSYWRMAKEEKTPVENLVWQAKRQWQRLIGEEEIEMQTGYIRPTPPLY